METLLNAVEQISVISGGLLQSIGRVLGLIWWIILPILVIEIFWRFRLSYIRMKFVKKIKWVVLELKIPRDILKTPKSMEQIFSNLYGLYSFGITNPDKYIDGKVESYISLEIVGSGDGVHFYIRTSVDHRNLVESAIYSQYPSAEVVEVPDYTEMLPRRIPNKDWDLMGTSFQFVKDNYYPIRTYNYFEDKEDERRIDPIASIIEVASSLKEGEMIWIQYLVCPTGGPTGNDWQKEGTAKMNEMAGKKPKPGKPGFGAGMEEFLKNLIAAPIRPPEWSLAKKEEKAEVQRLHPGDQDTIKAIANKVSKSGFETIIRFMYLDSREKFSPANFAAAMSAFQLFNDQTLNSLKPSKEFTKMGGWRAKFFSAWKKRKVYEKKRKLYDLYIDRDFYNTKEPAKKPVFCTEELATLYHIPSLVVEAPNLRKIEAKKSEPPANLPIEG